eukprot:1624177-Pleurochrysis_carterae.AAC.1
MAVPSMPNVSTQPPSAGSVSCARSRSMRKRADASSDRSHTLPSALRASPWPSTYCFHAGNHTYRETRG